MGTSTVDSLGTLAVLPSTVDLPPGAAGFDDPAADHGGLYVHIPFCLEKCGYCDFYSIALDTTRADETVDAILRELDAGLPGLTFAVRTIFVGGGTPTVLPRPGFDRLFERLGVVARAHAVEEFTVEANPATLDAGKAAVLRAAGVNRISFGAQSFHLAELAVLDRTHHPGAVQDSVLLARACGFEHINLDLIFGVPGQTPESWRSSLAQACALPIDHISCYGLTYEPNTALTARRDRGLITPMDEDRELELFELTGSWLAERGFERYETSNFARRLGPADGAGRLDVRRSTACRHNLVYWNNQPYLGVGPSAASYLRGVRRKNVPHLRAYLAALAAGRLPLGEFEIRDRDGFARDLAVLRLRLTEGLDLADFRRRCGLDARQFFAEALARHVRGGLLEDTGTHLRLTPVGYPLLNYVSRDFVA